MPVFKSKLDEIFDVKELDFELPPAFGKYRVFFPEEAVAHPAKAYTDVLEYIILKYTKPGDLVLDPMCGTGSTCIVGALYGRHGIGVDIEEKFIEWCLKAKEKLEKHQTFTPKGKVFFICGDARKLSEILNEKIAAIITSPPYAESISKHAGGPVKVKRVGVSTKTARAYSCNEKNIGNLPLGNIDAIITSPPYEAGLEGTSRHTKGGIASRDRKLAQTGTYFTLTEDTKKGVPISYSPNPNNIGNLRGETYIEAMLKVYRECWKVLKPGGKIIVIIKPFIRNKKVIDLPYHTYFLLEKVGFKTIEVFKYRLKRPSFWRILYYKKHPEVPRIQHEYVIVAEKNVLN